MRICILSSWPSIHTEHWLRTLSQRGHEVHLLSPYGQNPQEVPERVVVHPPLSKPAWKGSGPVLRALQLRRQLKEIAPDVLHVHSVFALEKWRQLPWIAALCAFHPLVLTAWGSDLLQVSSSSRAARWLMPFVLRSADLITADSGSVLDVAGSMGVRRERLHEIQFGVDTTLFHPGVDTRPSRRELNLDQGPVVFSPRALKPLYNQLSVLEAAPIVLRAHPHGRFIFKRRSDHHSEEYEGLLRKRIEELGLTEAVRIVPPVPYGEMPALYALSDVVVSVPASDGTPRSVLEAMACGSFPVVSDLPALHEWIHHGENGLFVRNTGPQEIAEAILKALSSRPLLHKAKIENRRIVETRAGHEFWASQMEALYRKLTRC